MPNQPERPKNRLDDLLDEIDYSVAPPSVVPVVPEYVSKHIEKAKQKLADKTAEHKQRYPDIRWPMCSGLFRFVFGPNTIRVLIHLSISTFLTIVTLLIAAILYGRPHGGSVNFPLAIFLLIPTMLCLGHIATCFLAAVESIANGLVETHTLPDFNPKQWFINFWYLFVISIPFLAIGVFIRRYIYTHESYQIYSAFVDQFCFFVFFPILFLSSFFAGGKWLPLGIVTVLRSMLQVWWAWGIFYLETCVLLMIWSVLTVICSFIFPLAFLLIPLFALNVLVYSFLIGRLAWCIDKAREE